MKKILTLPLFFLIGIVLLIFRQWILSSEIIGGDWPYFFSETLKGFTFFPPAWSLVHGNGLGGTILTYYLDQYLYFTAYLSTGILHIPWVVGYKLFWFGLFIALSIFSSIYLLKSIFPQTKPWQMGIAAFIFTANTYILMVVGGGQMGVALAYSVAPLVLVRFIKLINNLSSQSYNLKFKISNLKLPIVAGLILAVQVMFDPRIAYITMTAVVLYQILNRVNIVHALLLPVGIAVLLHSYWIFPLLVTRTLPIQEGFISVSGFEFFSFADFSHSLSLLHPNWPENIFGKTYFLKPEFLILPIIAFSSLLFTKNKTILFFSFLGLLGTFLAKGANPPFGEINQWLFQYIPGMNMFRDPTKWYTLVAVSYSMLIPFSIWKIYELLKSHNKFSIFNFQNLFLILTCFYLILLIRPALLGQLGGTFTKREVPKDYIDLKDFLTSQPDFFRTLWIPRQQRFTFVSNIHPAIEAIPLFKATNSAQIVSGLRVSESQRLLEELSVKYVIIPYDSLGEIFLKDRKYDERQYKNTIEELKKITWLRKREGFGKIGIFEVLNPKDHFWLESRGEITYEAISISKYVLKVSIEKPGNIVFAENFNPHWFARIGQKYITSNKTKDSLNSFELKKAGKYNIEIFYSQEKYFYYGRLVSLSTIIVLVILLIGIRRNFIFKK